MIVFKTEDMVETSAPAGTAPKRGTLLLTLFRSRSQQTSETKDRYSSSKSDRFPPVEAIKSDFRMRSSKRVAVVHSSFMEGIRTEIKRETVRLRIMRDRNGCIGADNV